MPWSKVMRYVLPIYAAVLVAIGLTNAWSAPLAWDEKTFYLPAIETMAAQLPHVSLQYALPQPPVMLVVQAALWRAWPSVAFLRAMATLAFIATIFIIARIVMPRNATTVLLVAMTATFPAMLANAYSLKQHTFTFLFLAAALLAWTRGRTARAAIFLALATLTNQLALAFGATLGILALSRLWRERSRAALGDTLLLGAALLPFAALVIVWHGVQPPAFIATFPDVAPPRTSPPQLMFALLMIGFWLEPLVAVWRRAVILGLLLTPVCSLFIHWSGIVEPFGAKLDGRAAGPIMSVIRALTPIYTVWVIAAGLLAAAGVLFFSDATSIKARLYVLICVAALLRVPFYFESYYALVICVAWLLLADVIAERRPVLVVPIQCAYVLFGAAYGAVKLL